MDENKIEQEVAEVEAVDTVADVEVEAEADVEVAEVEAEVPAEAPVEAEVVAEGCDCGKCETCNPKKETEDDEDEKKVTVKEGLQAEHDAKQRKEVAKEQSKDLLEALQDKATDIVADRVLEAQNSLPIEEGVSEEDIESQKAEIVAEGEQLLADVFTVLEEVVNGTTFELDGHQVEVKDFVMTGGKVGMGLPAGINPPCKSEDDESEKKVTIKAYHEGAEEVDYKAKFAESEALMDDLVEMVEKTSAKYTGLVEEYNQVVAQLQAYKISEAYAITVDSAQELLAEYDFSEVCEALDEVEAEERGEVIAEACEEQAEDKAEEKAEDKEDKEEEKKEEEQAKAMEEIKEEAPEMEVEGQVIEESVAPVQTKKAFSVFATNSIVESKKARKAYSVFAD